ncbi:flagellar P-ring protein precursor FlgI [Andreprevotia lacus DSM 23236]|jgi:flagellar P-ring protein precursor FlgI|uniref:Flagellar P-ring protein n=1 Tax=Andreprevotia lacus DSM 23236 TaxID=1121001 RepID=A0A1W1X0B7_9NEIS|nr:flagellar basal body P-ring protein FlgI [Andreprevotia lacus]SMC16831.1 flagellar P-ring protein precursor FlgI [Andreprevotia lacus DSM 23236]
MRYLIALLLSLGLAAAAHAEKLRELANVAGVRPNQLVGYGLVVGLDGSGDQTTQTPFTVQSIVNMLNNVGIQIPNAGNMQLKNVAAVTVTATLPPFARPGQLIDVTVSSIGNAKSLRGGLLIMAPLKGADGQVYAMAQGNLVVAGAGAAAGGSSTQVNQLATGRVPNGATVERAVPNGMNNSEFVQLELMQTDFTTASRVVNAINGAFGPVAAALDGRVVQVRAPQDPNLRVTFLSKLENIDVTPAAVGPKVIINARTGSIVMNQAVELDQCAISHGNLTITINANNQVSQPNPVSGGKTTAVQNADIQIAADKGPVARLPKSSSLRDVVRALNAVGATPQDLLAILQAMKAAGALKAELEII